MRKTEDVSGSKNFDYCGGSSRYLPVVRADPRGRHLTGMGLGAGLLKLSLTAHLGGTADRLTVNWHWRLIGLL